MDKKLKAETQLSIIRTKTIRKQIEEKSYTGDKDKLILNLLGFIENVLTESLKK
jgi:hypothetical protein